MRLLASVFCAMLVSLHAMACPTILALKRTMTQQKTTLEQ